MEKIQRMEDFRACEELQRRIWGFGDIDIVPALEMRAVQDHGGLVLGAFVDRRLVGFAFSFLGRTGGRLHHHSDMTGVLRGERYRGLGFRLKTEQRRHVVAQGIDLITWTVDPLEGANAHFNFRKLGATARDYLVDYYGPMEDDLNRGLPTDRLQVEWWLEDPRVRALMEGKVVGEPNWSSAPLVNETGPVVGGLRAPRDHDLQRVERALQVEIPWDIHAIKATAPELALEWRLHLRRILQHYFARGYAVADFFADRRYRRNYYILEEGGA